MAGRPGNRGVDQHPHLVALRDEAVSPVTIAGPDGYPIDATWYASPDAPARSIVMLPAFSRRCSYLGPLASWMQHRGWGVLLFNYRGMEPSAPARLRATLTDWATKDLVAAVRWIRREVGPRFLAALGHSIGGQLLPQSPVRDTFGAVVHVAAPRGYWPLWTGFEKAVVYAVWHVTPLVARLLGSMPVGLFGMRGCYPVPRDAYLQWCRWGRERDFTDGRGRSLEPVSRTARVPILAYSFTDDRLYAPRRAVEELHRTLDNCSVDHRHVDPAEYGLRRIGHSGFFDPACERTLWEEMLRWLEAQRERTPRGRTARPHEPILMSGPREPCRLSR